MTPRGCLWDKRVTSSRRPEEPPGGHVSLRCPSCGHPNRADRRYCAACGAHLGQACPSCGTRNNPEEKFCGACGAALTEAAAEGERRQLTVLFCDLVGSTAIAGQLDPEDWREIAADYQRAAAETVTRFGGHVAKYLGDGVLVYFGYPQAHEDDPERAVRGGLALLDTVAELNRRLEPAHGVRLAVRVGMHTGPVVIGGGAARGAEVFGDTPNVAARVQALADPDAVLITEATHRLVSGRFIVEAKGAPPLKGVRTPVAVYRVVQASGVRSRLAAAGPRGLTPFVGREAERRLLAERWAQAQAGDGQLVLITGEAGIGKSRLVQAFREDIGGEPHTWIECTASPYHEHTPFYAMTEMLRQALAWQGDEPVDERITRLERSVAGAGLQPAEAVPLVAPLLDLPVPDRYAPLPFTVDAQRKKLLATLVGWLLGLARLQPAVVVLEDLQWLDPSTLELQGTLVERGETAPLLILYTARPEFRAPWPLLAHHAQVTLGRLGRRQVREMVTRVAARTTRLDELIEAVALRTDGVPLFVEELTKAVLEGEGDETAPARAIPATLQDSLMARLDRLGPAKEVAQVASVIGRQFSYALLRAVSTLAEPDLQASLGRLVAAELVYGRGVPPEATYVFKHALVRETAYGSLLKSRRRELHRAIATGLGEKFPALAEAQPEVVAHHWTEAGDGERAAAAWQQAGERAAARSAYVEAVDHLTKAFEVLATLPRTPERTQQEFLMEMPLFQALLATEGSASPRLAELMAETRARGDDVYDSPHLFIVLVGRWAFLLSRGELLAAQTVADRLFDMAEKSGSHASLVWGHLSRGSVKFFRGDVADAREELGRAIGAYDQRDHEGLIQDPGVAAMTFAGLAAWQVGRADEARRRLREAVDLARRIEKPYELASALANAGILNVYRREPECALQDADAIIQLCTEQQFLHYLAHGLGQRGWALVALGRHEEGLTQLRRALDTTLRTGMKVVYTLYAGLLAESLAETGAVAEAMRALEDTLAAAPGMELELPEWLRFRGDLLARQGADAATVEAAYRQAIELARRQGARSYELRAATCLGRWLASHRRAGDARDALTPLYASFTEGFDTRDLREAKALLEELG